jgi:hypothetical protein
VKTWENDGTNRKRVSCQRAASSFTLASAGQDGP